MSNQIKIAIVATLLACNGVAGAYLSKAIRDGSAGWYLSYVTSFVSASIFAYQLKSKILPLTVMSVFQTFFFHAAWYITAFFILNNELQGHKLVGLLMAFVGMIIMSF